MSSGSIEWIDEPNEQPPAAVPPRRSWTALWVLAVVAAAVIGFVVGTHHGRVVRPVAASRSNSVALPPALTSAPDTPSPVGSGSLYAPVTPYSSPPPEFATCKSLVGTASSYWEPYFLNGPNSGAGCTLDGVTAADVSILTCISAQSLYTTTAGGTWYWGESGQTLHQELAATSDAFTQTYQKCVGIDSTNCLTAAQAFTVATRPNTTQYALDARGGYGCDGGWAYVNFHPLPTGNEGTVALHLQHGAWLIGNRVVGCGDGVHAGTMPAAIQRGGCGN